MFTPMLRIFHIFIHFYKIIFHVENWYFFCTHLYKTNPVYRDYTIFKIYTFGHILYAYKMSLNFMPFSIL